jgi:hypothetical protein
MKSEASETPEIHFPSCHCQLITAAPPGVAVRLASRAGGSAGLAALKKSAVIETGSTIGYGGCLTACRHQEQGKNSQREELNCKFPHERLLDF